MNEKLAFLPAVPQLHLISYKCAIKIKNQSEIIFVLNKVKSEITIQLIAHRAKERGAWWLSGKVFDLKLRGCGFGVL